MKEIIIISAMIVGIIALMYFAYRFLHRNDFKKDSVALDDFIKQSLNDEREWLMLRYNDLRTKMNEVPPEYSDIVYREYKNIEEKLEINRARFIQEMKNNHGA